MSQHTRIDNNESEIHTSKIPPDDPRLTITKKGRQLKKNRVWGILVGLSGIILLGITMTVLPNNTSVTKEQQVEAQDKIAINENPTIPNSITNAPDSIEAQPDIETTQIDDANVATDLNQTPPALKDEPPTYDQDPEYLAYLEDKQREQDNEQAQLDQASLEFQINMNTITQQHFNQKNSDHHIYGPDEERDLTDVLKKIQGQSNGSTPADDDYALQNQQNNKRQFLNQHTEMNHYLASQMQSSQSPYEVKAGSIIPLTLITGINSDLPGQIIGQVRENVFDTVTGNHLLIPQGSRLIASYDASVAFGQERVLVCWNRLIRPDGSSLNLECAPGIDLAGYTGFQDQVDHHWMRLITGVVFSSVLSATATTSQDNNDEQSLSRLFAANIGQEVHNVGQQITQKNLNIQPTLKIRPGYSVNVFVHKDMILKPFE